MRYAVRHLTRFRYEQPVTFARCNLRLKPIDWPGQRLEDHALEITPAGQVGETRPGAALANVTRMVIDRPVRELLIESRATLVVDRALPQPQAGDAGAAEVAALARGAADVSPTSPAAYLFPTQQIGLHAEITAWCAETIDPAAGLVGGALALAQRMRAEFRYDGEATETDTPPAVAFAQRAGVCQDFAQIMIAGLRGLGMPAAYVSGYLRTLPPPGRPRLVGADATHAWVLLWCGPARGWVGFDPTNGVAMGPDHIVTAIGRDYADVAPIDGVFIGRGGQEIEVSVDVEPLEAPATAAA